MVWRTLRVCCPGCTSWCDVNQLVSVPCHGRACLIRPPCLPCHPLALQRLEEVEAALAAALEERARLEENMK